MNSSFGGDELVVIPVNPVDADANDLNAVACAVCDHRGHADAVMADDVRVRTPIAVTPGYADFGRQSV